MEAFFCNATETINLAMQLYYLLLLQLATLLLFGNIERQFQASMTTTFRMKYIMARELLCHIENYCYSSDDVCMCFYVCMCVCARAHTYRQTHRHTRMSTMVGSLLFVNNFFLTFLLYPFFLRSFHRLFHLYWLRVEKWVWMDMQWSNQ